MSTLRRLTTLQLLMCLPACAHGEAPAPRPATAAPAAARPDTLSSADLAVERFLKSPQVLEAWFAPSFLEKVPFTAIQPLRDKLAAELGSFVRITGSDGTFDAAYEKGHLSVTAKLDGEGRFIGLMLKPVIAAARSMDDALDSFKKLAGKVSVLVLDGSTTLGALEPDAPLAVGSSFKLAALATLRAQIDAKKRSWRDIIELSPTLKSLPSGQLQDWPDGAPLTLYSLAGLMISRSDNTATDTLIATLGRKTIEPLASRNTPYLMTREMFLLKSHGNEPLLERYRSGDEAARRAVLDELQTRALPNVKDYPTSPTALDVEWFFTVRELCSLMRSVADLPLMTINPGVADKAGWSRVAYKGGSEPGVLNTTTWLEKGSHRYCVSTTWNAPTAVDEKAFFAADQRVFGYLASRP